MKQIEIIQIAKRKAARRGINENWILETVRSPEQIIEGNKDRKVAQKKYILRNKLYLLRVVYEEGEKELTVITAYLTSKIEYYWKD